MPISCTSLESLYPHEGAHTLHFRSGSGRSVADLDHERFAVLILHNGKLTAAFARLNEHEQRAVLAYRDKHGTSELRFSIYLKCRDSTPAVCWFLKDGRRNRAL